MKKRIVIIKRNKPAARAVPIKEQCETLFGKMQGTVQILGDLLAPIDGVWGASHHRTGAEQN